MHVITLTLDSLNADNITRGPPLRYMCTTSVGVDTILDAIRWNPDGTFDVITHPAAEADKVITIGLDPVKP